MNNQEKITVIHDHKFVLIFILLIILIPILIYLYSQFQKAPLEPKPSIVPTPTSISTPTPQLPSLETEGKLMKLDGKNLTLLVGTKEQTFTLTDSTVFYKCTDFNDINSCLIDKDNFKNAISVKVYSKGEKANFIQYK